MVRNPIVVFKEIIEPVSVKFSTLHYSMLCELNVNCPKCSQKIRLDKMKTHLDQCGPSTHAETPVLREWTNPKASDMLNLMVGDPIPPIMEEVLTHGVRMKLCLRTLKWSSSTQEFQRWMQYFNSPISKYKLCITINRTPNTLQRKKLQEIHGA